MLAIDSDSENNNEYIVDVDDIAVPIASHRREDLRNNIVHDNVCFGSRSTYSNNPVERISPCRIPVDSKKAWLVQTLIRLLNGPEDKQGGEEEDFSTLHYF